jgi:hypothetical protein
LTSAASIKTDLKLAVDGGDGAPTASHSIRDLWKAHFALTEQHYNSVEFTFGKILTLRPNHLASIPSTTGNSSNTNLIVVCSEPTIRGRLSHWQSHLANCLRLIGKTPTNYALACSLVKDFFGKDVQKIDLSD